MASPIWRRLVSAEPDLRNEVTRIRRTADMLCTAHANLRDRYARYATLLDLSIVALASWLVALAFVEPRLNVTLTPFHLDPQLWGGLLAIVTLFFSVIQLRVDWKGRSDAHKRALDVYAGVKREAGYLLATGELVSYGTARRVLARYDMASDVAIAVPEREFLRQKQAHKLKIALSKHLDDYPAASLNVARLKLWMRDNLGRRREESWEILLRPWSCLRGRRRMCVRTRCTKCGGKKRNQIPRVHRG